MLPFSQSEADYLISARKIIHRVVEDNTSGNYRASASPHSPPELRITYEICRKDNPGQTIKLQFHARKEQGARWGTSLKWKNVRVRGLDYKLREDVIRGGLIVARLSHWHEHVWTEENEDRNIVDANGFVKNEDRRAIIELCLDRWNIEGYGHQYTLEENR